MAKVEYADAIKTVSGALTKINKKSPHAGDQKMVLATHRIAPTTNPDCSRLYLRGLSAVTRNTPVTPQEQVVRARFTAISKLVKARKADLSLVASDLEAFNAQKETGYKTMKQYLWNVCAAQYDQNNG